MGGGKGGGSAPSFAPPPDNSDLMMAMMNQQAQQNQQMMQMMMQMMNQPSSMPTVDMPSPDKAGFEGIDFSDTIQNISDTVRKEFENSDQTGRSDTIKTTPKLDLTAPMTTIKSLLNQDEENA